MSRNIERASRATKVCLYNPCQWIVHILLKYASLMSYVLFSPLKNLSCFLMSQDESPAWEMPYGDNRKKPAARPSDVLAMSDGIAKRARFDTSATSNLPVLGSSDYSDMQTDNDANVGHLSDPALLNSDVSPVEKMIEMIGALLAEGERGAESLGILVSTVEADVMADIVIETMKHLPGASFPSAKNNGVQKPDFKYSSGLLTENLAVNSDSSLFAAPSTSTADGVSISPSDPLFMPGVHDAKRDPRRVRSVFW